jgi:hypothetical protein
MEVTDQSFHPLGGPTTVSTPASKAHTRAHHRIPLAYHAFNMCKTTKNSCSDPNCEPVEYSGLVRSHVAVARSSAGPSALRSPAACEDRNHKGMAR